MPDNVIAEMFDDGRFVKLEKKQPPGQLAVWTGVDSSTTPCAEFARRRLGEPVEYDGQSDDHQRYCRHRVASGIDAVSDPLQV
ncbi:hypothetical protein MINTM015_22410 [Mycobacterium paraintracellulare]|nr:hypothetical protein MINTM015_22410 [Mycobacterium paraintracellulare]